MRAILTLLIVVSIVTPVAADPPKPGSYVVKSSDFTIVMELKAHRSGNFTVTGAIQARRRGPLTVIDVIETTGSDGKALIAGTLYTRTNRLALRTLEDKPTPLDARWDPVANTIVMTFGGKSVALRQSREDEVTTEKRVNFTGTWDTNWGPMTLSQSGETVTGSYVHEGGQVTAGKVKGASLSFRWNQVTNRNHGEAMVRFYVEDGVEKFTGAWKDHTGRTGGWEGSKRK